MIGRRLWDRLLYAPNRDAIVVLGNQKSGTSAIAHLLADACGLTKTVDVPEVWPPVFQRLLRGERDLASLADSCPKPFSRELIKEPYLTFVPRQVRDLFTGGRYAFVCRDPRDNIRSILDRLGMPGDLRRCDPAPEDLPPAWAPTFDPEVWQAESGRGDYVGILAERWVRATRVLLEWPGRIALVRYEDFCRDKAGAIEELADTLRLPVVADISDRVDVQFQPRGNRDVSWNEFFGPENLDRIEAVCGSLAARLGYAERPRPEDLAP